MPEVPGWLRSDLFDRFPLALAVVDRRGTLQALNGRFTDRFARTQPSHTLLSFVEPSQAGWRPVCLLRPDGTEQQVFVQSLPTDQGVMLVVDEPLRKARSIELEHLHRRVLELERESSTDALTGAWNRAHLDRVIATEIARSRRFRQPLALVLVDIDHFKRVNDTHGHLVGDATLQHLVTLMRSRTRSGDLLFRWGGEEFVVLAASTGYRGAKTVAENLRRAVAAAPFPVVGTVTISVGVAEHMLDETQASWFARADRMLYAAKEGGRDRVVVDRCGSSDHWAMETGSSALRLAWNEGLECGNRTIDAEHRRLFDLANLLIEASITGDLPACTIAMDRLIEHAVQHFEDEEAVLEQVGYPHLAAHRAAHVGLRGRASTLRAGLEAGKMEVGAVVEFLARDLVANHILTADRAFYPWITGEPVNAHTR